MAQRKHKTTLSKIMERDIAEARRRRGDKPPPVSQGSIWTFLMRIDDFPIYSTIDNRPRYGGCSY